MKLRKWWLGFSIVAMIIVAGTFLLATGTLAVAPPLQNEEDIIMHLPVAPYNTGPATPTPRPTRPPTDSIVVDHMSLADFERIPDEYIAAAQGLRMIFIDRSVGSNINDGLTCLSYPSSTEAPNHCVRYEHEDPAFSVDPSVVSWNRPGGYDRSNWEFQGYSSACEGGGWTATVPCFIQMVEPHINSYDVLSFQFSYLAVDESSTIASQPGGYFWNNASANIGDVYDQEAFEAQHPDKVFIYWTTSLARGIGTSVAEQFNEQMRQYAIANDKPLFDVADILSHDPDGNPCYDNRDGVPYDNGNNSENYPDDGQDYPAICQHYTTETDGGHLGRVSAGKIRVAKAFWVLMARIAGWDGS